MVRSEVYIDSQEILTLESFPPQFRLHVIGSLPTPCHKLRAVVYEPDEQNQIHVQIFSWVDPDIVCAQVLQALDASIPLGSYASGSYRVFVNGAEVGQINPLISEGSTLRGTPADPPPRLKGDRHNPDLIGSRMRY